MESRKDAITDKEKAAIDAEIAEIDRQLAELHKEQEKNNGIRSVVCDNGAARILNLPDYAARMLNKYEEKEPEWLIHGWIPKYQITVLCGDGGSGKTSLWCHLAAKLSAGEFSIFERDFAGIGLGKADPLNVMFFSSEDSIEYTLIRRLKNNNACLSNISTIDLKDERFAEIKFNSEFLENLIAENKPDVMIFDPLQSFIPPNIKMGQRNEMRSCLNPLIGLGEKYKVTSLIIMHTNKQSGMYGRKRMADSSDVWDISRSVIMLGETTQKGIRYVSQEKCNYGPLQKTLLFELENSVPVFRGNTDKHDREFVKEYDYNTGIAPQRDEAKEFILDYLKDGEKEVADLDEMAAANGISKNALKNAKAELKKTGQTKTWSVGYGENKRFYIHLLEQVS